MPAGHPPAQALLEYLGAGAPPDPAPAAPPAPPAAPLREAAQALMRDDDPLRLGLRAGELTERIGWFLRLLELLPPTERDDWLHAQLRVAQGHPLAGSPLHGALDPRLFDPLLNTGQRLRLQALWLAVVAPGAFSLDAGRREREQAQALALLDGWLQAG